MTSFGRVRTTLALLAMACLLAGALGLGPCLGAQQGCCDENASAGAAAAGDDGCCDHEPGGATDSPCVKHACCFGVPTALPGALAAIESPLPSTSRLLVRPFAPPADPDGRDILHVPKTTPALLG